jgi:AcrR family transcriptional regulator
LATERQRKSARARQANQIEAGYRPGVPKSGAKGDDPAGSGGRLPRGRHGLPREMVAENQRERLISGVIAAVAENGYAETTIATIVKAAELSRKTFYEHFANKEECFAAAYETSFEYLRQTIDKVEVDGDWGQLVRARLERLLALLSEESDLASFFLIAPTSAGDEIVERHHKTMRELVRALTKGAPAVATKGEPLETREQALAGGISRLVVLKLSAGEADQLPDLVPALTELVLRPYLGGEEAVKVAGEGK